MINAIDFSLLLEMTLIQSILRLIKQYCFKWAGLTACPLVGSSRIVVFGSPSTTMLRRQYWRHAKP